MPLNADNGNDDGDNYETEIQTSVWRTQTRVWPIQTSIWSITRRTIQHHYRAYA